MGPTKPWIGFDSDADYRIRIIVTNIYFINTCCKIAASVGESLGCDILISGL